MYDVFMYITDQTILISLKENLLIPKENVEEFLHLVSLVEAQKEHDLTTRQMRKRY